MGTASKTRSGGLSLKTWLIVGLVLWIGYTMFWKDGGGPAPGPRPEPGPITNDFERLGAEFVRTYINGVADVHEQTAAKRFDSPQEAFAYESEQLDLVAERAQDPLRHALQQEMRGHDNPDKLGQILRQLATGMRSAVR